MADKPKPELLLTGPRVGGPSLDDIVALYRRLTGKEPTEKDLAECREILAGRMA